MRPTLPVGEHVPMPAADVHPTSRQQPGVLGLLLAVQERFRDIRGQNAASALTLSLFLSIFPLILVAVSVLGFVSAGDPNFVKDTIDSLNLTGEAQKIFTNAMNSAQENRGAAGESPSPCGSPGAAEPGNSCKARLARRGRRQCR